jgi:FixJ family two-component response regulator
MILLRECLDLIQKANKQGVKAPLIMITGRGRYELDIEAMNSGAADYLTKDTINPPMLERVIRYSLERSRSRKSWSRWSKNAPLSCRMPWKSCASQKKN